MKTVQTGLEMKPSLAQQRCLVPIVFSVLLSLLTACGSDSYDNSETNAYGTLSLAVTDAPVDEADKVVVRFNGVEIKPMGGSARTFTFAAPRDIDLLNLQAGTVAPLIVNEQVLAGQYEWARLLVSAEFDNVMDSYIEIRGAQFELRVPSGSESGLKLVSGFTVPQGGAGNYTIDFDLRKSVVDPGGQPGYFLKPVLRLVDNTQVGTLTGRIDPALVATQCDGAELGAVYVFNGADVVPDDVDGNGVEPVASGLVVQEQDGDFVYRIAFLLAGNYTIAYTCDAVSDLPETDEALDFFGSRNVSITAGMTTTADFSPAVPTGN